MIDPEDDDCSDLYGGQEGMCASVEAHGDASPVLEFSEHVFQALSEEYELVSVWQR